MVRQKKETKTLLALALLAMLPLSGCLDELEVELPEGGLDVQGEIDVDSSAIDLAGDEEIDLEHRALEIEEERSYREDYSYGSCSGAYWGRRCWNNSDCPHGSRCYLF